MKKENILLLVILAAVFLHKQNPENTPALTQTATDANTNN